MTGDTSSTAPWGAIDDAFAPSIGDYGLISDCQTCALVGRDGAIDWYCPGRFDASSVFARLLDPHGGTWSIRPRGWFETRRAYVGDTMVLRTEFRTAGGRIAITNAMALDHEAREHEIGKLVPHMIVRRVEGIEGSVEIDMTCSPRFEYALTLPRIFHSGSAIVAEAGPTDLILTASCEMAIDDESTIRARRTVRAGETVDFALRYRPHIGEIDLDVPDVDVGVEIENARRGWTSWSEMHQSYTGRYTAQVRRSALVLQALTYQPTGAVVAAPTTSLPERPGSDGTWDYRFVWLRDLSLTMRALWQAACPDEARQLFRWLARANGEQWTGERPIQIMYGVGGERDLTEHVLGHLAGFQGTGSVRVGNDAWSQKQLDVLGEVIDAVYLFRDQPEFFDDVITRMVSALATTAAQSWREPDAGMWEARDKERHYLSSKVMCWVALDRAVKLAPVLGRNAPVDDWRAARDEARAAILDQGWCESVGAYTGAFGSDHLDASVLLMPLVDFLPATDPRMKATIDIIAKDLVDNGLVHRWAGDEHGFLICTYWLSECLARAGETSRATEIFERTTAHANDLGLLAEEADPATGELWGNFPQAFSHVGLINAAATLNSLEDPERQAS